VQFLEEAKSKLEAQLGRQQLQREAATENKKANESPPDGEDQE